MTRKRWWVACGLVALATGGCEPSAKELHEAAVREYQTGRTVAAKGLFEEALAKKPEQYESAFHLGMCHKAVARAKFRDDDYAAAMRELDQAAFYFGQAIESYPGYVAAIKQKAEVLKLKGRYAEALRLAEWAKENTGTQQGQLVMLANELADAGDFDGALVRLRQAVALDPADSAVHAALGRLYLRFEKRSQAAAAFKRAYRINPAEPGVVEALAELGYRPTEAGSATPAAD